MLHGRIVNATTIIKFIVNNVAKHAGIHDVSQHFMQQR
jgi:hypothetical protein